MFSDLRLNLFSCLFNTRSLDATSNVLLAKLIVFRDEGIICEVELLSPSTWFRIDLMTLLIDACHALLLVCQDLKLDSSTDTITTLFMSMDEMIRETHNRFSSYAGSLYRMLQRLNYEYCNKKCFFNIDDSVVMLGGLAVGCL